MSRHGADPERDLETLAHFAWLFEGASLPLDVASLESVHHDGRPDGADAHTAEVRRAVEALHRLDELLAQRGGERRVLVLLWAYYWHGADARGQWAQQGGFVARLGLTFASPAQRQAWLLHPSRKIGQAAAGEFGYRLLDDAVEAYAELDEVCADGERPRLALDRVRDVLSRHVLAVERDIEELTGARERRRIASGKRTARARRAAEERVTEPGYTTEGRDESGG